MIQLFHRMISAALGISEKQIGHTLDLLEDGATIPFISRYRKATGGLDEVQIEAIKTHYEKLNRNSQTERDHHQHHQRAGENDSRTAKTY